MEIQATNEFYAWLGSLKDERATAVISRRLAQIGRSGRIVGDVHPVGGGVSEMRFHTGPGYRVYFAQKGHVLVLLLIGGDKSSQEKDIRKAVVLLDELKEAEKW